MWGRGREGAMATCSTLCQISVTPSTTHNQTGALWCWFPSGWACAHSRPLWVFPTTSSVRLGVSPAAPTLMGIFNQRFEALFPPRWSPGLRSLLCSPPFIPVYLCANVEGSASARTACTVCLTLSLSQSHSHVSPLHHSARLRPSYRSG